MMMMKLIQTTFAFACLTILIHDVTNVSCYRPSLLSTTRQSLPRQPTSATTPKTVTTATTTTRRQWFNGIVAATTAAATMTAGGIIQPANAVISSKYCAYGEGAGCEDLAEGNPLILELQQRSSKNKETIQRETLNAYYMKNYPDFFATVGKNMIKKADGTFMIVTDEELDALVKDNKIGIEYAKAMGGKVMDYTQKPIRVLKE